MDVCNILKAFGRLSKFNRESMAFLKNFFFYFQPSLSNYLFAVFINTPQWHWGGAGAGMDWSRRVDGLTPPVPLTGISRCPRKAARSDWQLLYISDALVAKVGVNCPYKNILEVIFLLVWLFSHSALLGNNAGCGDLSLLCHFYHRHSLSSTLLSSLWPVSLGITHPSLQPLLVLPGFLRSDIYHPSSCICQGLGAGAFLSLHVLPTWSPGQAVSSGSG